MDLRVPIYGIRGCPHSFREPANDWLKMGFHFFSKFSNCRRFFYRQIDLNFLIFEKNPVLKLKNSPKIFLNILLSGWAAKEISFAKLLIINK